ncbi:MAG: hypothetical protein WCF90_09940 [Methanomicrobiales archaeon]
MGATLDLINGMPGVQRATPHFTKGATLKYRQRILGASLRAISLNGVKLITPLYMKMIAGRYIRQDDTGKVIIGKPVAGAASIRQEDEF